MMGGLVCPPKILPLEHPTLILKEIATHGIDSARSKASTAKHCALSLCLPIFVCVSIVQQRAESTKSFEKNFSSLVCVHSTV